MTYNYRGGRTTRRPNRFHSQPRRSFQGAYIDVSKFINKKVSNEKVEQYVPKNSFNNFDLQTLLKTNIAKKGYLDPTPIQDQVISHICEGKDVVGIANTGTGKTGAFLIPLIDKILRNPREKVLVIVPTRELAQQIDEELRAFAKNSKLFSVLCIGGANIGKQIRELRYEHQFVIGTPGRLKDLVEQGIIHLPAFKTVVLDEADRMLDMGFIADIRFMLAQMAKDRHTLFFSATMSPKIKNLIHEFLVNPVHISVKTQDTPNSVHQDVVRVPAGKNKVDILEGLIKQDEFKKVLVFGRTKHGVEKLSKELGKRGLKAESIHGNKRQQERQRSLDLFKKDHAQVLTATDVAARGLDISGVTHVINFDVPATYEDYIHRIGRTGRGDQTGKALTFIG